MNYIKWLNLTLTVVITMLLIGTVVMVIQNKPVPVGTTLYFAFAALVYSAADTLKSFFPDET